MGNSGERVACNVDCHRVTRIVQLGVTVWMTEIPLPMANICLFDNDNNNNTQEVVMRNDGAALCHYHHPLICC